MNKPYKTKVVTSKDIKSIIHKIMDEHDETFRRLSEYEDLPYILEDRIHKEGPGRPAKSFKVKKK